MSFTKSQEQKLAALADAIEKDTFVSVDELPDADMSEDDKLIEVYSKKGRKSEKMSLKQAVNKVGGGSGISDEDREKIEQAIQIATKCVPMTEAELDNACT